ncbi:unnamed protein product [Heterosigma akashiwo]|mmetsp:Transcript_8725/g.13680  ORF Transcript_8725/g.13680 Transcript_8725/m.13680 type:complete len:215 (+) Transcript_8725:112-756(+)
MGNQNCFDYEAKPRDPITLGSLDKHKFIFFRQLPGGDYVHVEYNLSSLIDYFLKSGDFVEPESRIEFTDEDLLRLDLQAKMAGFQKPSVYEAKKNPAKFEKERQEQALLTGLERCAGDTISSMMAVVENMSSEDGQIILLADLLPSFLNYYEKMKHLDGEHAKQSMLHYKLYLKGPPNKPTQDKNGLLPMVISFLDEITAEKSQLQDFGFPVYC